MRCTHVSSCTTWAARANAASTAAASPTFTSTHTFDGGAPAGEDGDHAGRGERRGDLDTSDARVRVRRTYEGGIHLAGQVDVVAVAARAGEQARVILAQDRLADSFARRPGPRLE